MIAPSYDYTEILDNHHDGPNSLDLSTSLPETWLEAGLVHKYKDVAFILKHTLFL